LSSSSNGPCQEQRAAGDPTPLRIPFVKNRYCRNSKLSEEVFLQILLGFYLGWSATAIHKVLKGKVSRQTIEAKFVDIGFYIYRKLSLPTLIENIRELNPGMKLSDLDLEQEIINALWSQLNGNLDYESFRAIGSAYPMSEAVYAELRVPAHDGHDSETMADTIPTAWRTVFRPHGGHFGGGIGTLSAMIPERCRSSPARGR
jgi:hypothetical protein